MAGLSGITIKVTPEVLTAKSSDVAKKVSDMKQQFSDLKDLVDKTKGYWIGEAGDKHRNMYLEMVGDIDEILKRLGEHPVDLVAIAQQYSDVELKIEQDIAALPGDIIV